MNQLLFDRSTGNLGSRDFARLYTSQLVERIQLAPKLRFDGGEKEYTASRNSADATGALKSEPRQWAHQAGVNALDIDIDDSILVSGGADSSIKLWNLEDVPNGDAHTLQPTAAVSRNASAHKFGITHLSFYPFDSAAFLSSSYDHHLKLYSTETLQASADFDLGSIVYTHALSKIANHLLVACATQNPTVRLVDLHSGFNTHSLAGHSGAILSVSWSPKIDHILASGATDGTIRLWDIRKSSGSLGVLNLEDSTGSVGFDGLGRGARSRDCGKAHQGAVNGLTWSDDGAYIVSAGHDERVRVWNSATGANTLASFGPTLKNSHLSSLPLIVSPTAVTQSHKDLLFYPNEKELLMFELYEGKLLNRLRVPGPVVAAHTSRTGERNIKNRITALAWRGQIDGIFSAHTDGRIRAWFPRTEDHEITDQEEEEGWKDHDESESAKRKRQILDDVFRDLTKRKITFG